MRFLITAGPTVEDIDPVRYISNRATGKLGFALASAAAKAGHDVTLIHGSVSESILNTAPKKAKNVAVRSAAEMYAAVMAEAKNVDVVVMNAAVADYTPVKLSATKLKKSADGLTLKLKPTADILKALGKLKGRKKRPVLIGFALETGDGKTTAAREKSAEAYARKKLESKNLDMIVLNGPETIGAAESSFSILSRGTVGRVLVKESKEAVAKILVMWAESLADQIQAT